jgi:hypothetical protein
MLSETRTSILSAVLTCIGERICAILLQPGNKAETYITSLHNEVVSSIQCCIMCMVSFHLGLSLLPCGSLVFCHLMVPDLLCQSQSGSRFTVFWTFGSQAATLHPTEASCRQVQPHNQTLFNLILWSGGKLEKGRKLGVPLMFGMN